MRAHRPLRPSGRARGVKDRGVVVGSDLDVRQGLGRLGQVVVGTTDPGLEAGALLWRAARHEHLQVRKAVEVGSEALGAFGVDHHHPGAAVPEQVGQDDPGLPGV